MQQRNIKNKFHSHIDKIDNDTLLLPNGIVQDVPYSELCRQLLEEGQRLDVDQDEWPPYLPEDV